MNHDDLRKACRKKMIDQNLGQGSLTALSICLSERLEKKINPRSLSMALTGYRKTASYRRTLHALHAMLSEQRNMSKETIHDNQD